MAEGIRNAKRKWERKSEILGDDHHPNGHSCRHGSGNVLCLGCGRRVVEFLYSVRDPR
jgi:hypothetical protein